MSQLSESIRKEFARQDAIRDAGITVPEDVERFDDIAYGPACEQKLDVYRPEKETGSLPVIVNVHGGAWVYGSKELYQYYAMSLAQRGFAVVNFSYRLAPEWKFPAQLEDVHLAFEWTREHAEEYGFDLDNLFAVGDSAGAHLLGLYCNACTNPEYAAQFSFARAFGPGPKAVSLACGVYTIEDDGESDQHLALMRDLLAGKVDEEALAGVDVRRYLTSRFPPAFAFTCNGDFLQKQADMLQQTLRERGVVHLLRFYAAPDKTLGHVFHLNVRLKEAVLCNDEQCAFFRKVMEGKL